jgi:hypothetical protein
MIIGSDAIIMDYADARALCDTIRMYISENSSEFKKLQELGYSNVFDKLQTAVREIEHRKLGED